MTVPAASEIDLSVVVPVCNEAGNLAPLVAGLDAALADWRYEIVFVDDGSTDDTAARLALLAAGRGNLKCFRHLSRCGQSAALRTAILRARGRVIATLDGDGQNPPAEVPKLVRHLLDGPATVKLVQGQRQRRQDTAWKRFGSRFANAIRGKLLKDDVRDSGCGLKAFYRDAYLQLAYFDHLHRFMPAMMLREGFEVAVLPVAHAERGAGRSKYGNLDRALVGIVDLMGVFWLMRRRALSEVREISPKAAEAAAPDEIPDRPDA